MKTPFNIISLSCFQISSQCFIVLDIRVICMQINWVLHVFYDCEKLQVGMHITCSGARYRSCMKKCVSIHVLFELEHRTIERGEQCDWGVGWGVNQHSSKFLNLSTKTSSWGHLFRTQNLAFLWPKHLVFVVKNVHCFVHLFCPCEHVYTNGLLPKEIMVHPPPPKKTPKPHTLLIIQIYV